MEPKLTPSEILQRRKYDPNNLPDHETIILTIDNKNIGSLQNFIILSGKQKQGKTRFAAIMTAAALLNDERLNIKIKLPPGRKRVAYFDTEQSDFDFYKLMNTIKRMTGEKDMPPHFDTYNMREDTPQDITDSFEQYLKETPDCAIIFLDGLLDMVVSFNDEAECSQFIRRLMKLAKIHNVLIVGILHKSKSADSTIGHLGAFADRKAQSILSVEKNKDRIPATFILKGEYLRSADDFEPIEIFYNSQSYDWEIAEKIFINEMQTLPTSKRNRRPEDYEEQEHKDKITRIFNTTPTQDYKALLQSIVEIYGVGKNWAADCVSYLLERSLIYKNDDGYTNRQQAKLFISA